MLTYYRNAIFLRDSKMLFCRSRQNIYYLRSQRTPEEMPAALQEAEIAIDFLKVCFLFLAFWLFLLFFEAQHYSRKLRSHFKKLQTQFASTPRKTWTYSK